MKKKTETTILGLGFRVVEAPQFQWILCQPLVEVTRAAAVFHHHGYEMKSSMQARSYPSVTGY